MEDYDLKEQAYQAIVSELHQKIDQEYAEKERQNEQKEHLAEAETDKNLEMKQRRFGGTEKENQDKEKAKEANRNNRKAFIQQDIARKKEQADDFAEVKVFGKKWGRLEAREAAYGPHDLIVVSLREQKREFDNKQEVQRKNVRASVGNPHQLETQKGKYTEHFNDKTHER